MTQHCASQGQSSRESAIQSAADELGDRLKYLADQLSTNHHAKRVPFGHGRLGNSFRPRSPQGYVVDPANLQMLLPDGRLWTFSRSDAQRFPAGRTYDARLHTRQHSQVLTAGAGVARADGGRGDSSSSRSADSPSSGSASAGPEDVAPASSRRGNTPQ
jgi:hypothetical protein